MSSNRIGTRVAAVLVLPLAAMTSVVAGSSPAQAAPMTFAVTSEACTGPNTFVDAVLQANANPGSDMIDVQVAKVNVCTQADGSLGRHLVTITESVTITGNGVEFLGNQKVVTDDGKLNPLTCPLGETNSTVVSAADGLARIGVDGADNSAIDVSMTNVSVTNLPFVFTVYDRASLTVDTAKFSKIQNFKQGCERSPIVVDTDAELTITDATYSEGWLDTDGFQPAMIQGAAGSTIELENFVADSNVTGFAVDTAGATTNIVSSVFVDSGGFRNGTGTMNLVNSAWQSSLSAADHNPRYQFQQLGAGGTMHLEATSLWVGSPYCSAARFCTFGGGNPTRAEVMPFNIGAGTLELIETAVGGLLDDDPAAAKVVHLEPGATATSDAATWIQPRDAQDAIALAGLLPNVLTAPPGLSKNPFEVYPATITPLLGDTSTPGQLIDVIDVGCVANAVLNPIDGSPIVSDVLGNDRCDVGNGKRNIGAVQLTLAPHLVVSAVGDGTVDLSWTRPQDPSSGTISGYAVLYRPVGSANPPTRIDVTGPDTVTTQVSSLTNGTAYEFEVVAVNSTGDGPASNQVTATPSARPGTPTATAAPGDQQVALSWTTPPDGGAPLVAYIVQYRPAGTIAWTTAPTTGTDTSTTVTGLTNATTYEFRVAGINRNGEGPFGPTVTATPQATVPPSTTTPATTTPATTTPPATTAPAITTPPTTPPTSLAGTLPETGSATGSVGLVAVLLLGLGILMLAAGRRRTTY